MTAIHSYHFAELDSTQTYLLKHAALNAAVFCRAERQTAGIGQRGAQWQSPQGGLYFSLRYPLAGGAALHGGLAQACALSIAECLDPAAQSLRLKWPNDLYVGEKKMGGILIDMLGDSAVIGIGINLRGERQDIAYVDEHFPALKTDECYPRLQEALLHMLEKWARHPYLALNHRWNDYDRFYGQDIRLEARTDSVRNLGIDQKGRLIIADGKGITCLSNARISLQP